MFTPLYDDAATGFSFADMLSSSNLWLIFVAFLTISVSALISSYSCLVPRRTWVTARSLHRDAYKFLCWRCHCDYKRWNSKFSPWMRHWGQWCIDNQEKLHHSVRIETRNNRHWRPKNEKRCNIYDQSLRQIVWLPKWWKAWFWSY